MEIPEPGMRRYNKQHSSAQSSVGQSGTPIIAGMTSTTTVVTWSMIDGKDYSPLSYFDQTLERSSPAVTFCCAS